MRLSSLAVVPLAAVGVAVALAGCSTASGAASSGSSDGTIDVVASTDVWGSIASTVGGDRAKVTSIIDDPDKDPHEYEADARTQLKLSKAEVVIENGGGYDDFVDTMLKSASNDKAVKINAVDVSGFAASAGEELNEHVWYDFPTVAKVADRIASAFAKIEPAHAAEFRANAAGLATKLDALEKKEAEAKTTYAGEGVAITEPVPVYMLDAMGLEDRTPEKFSEAIENGSDVAPLVLQQTLALFSDHQVKALVYNEQTSGPQTEAVLAAAKKAGIPAVPVTETLPKGDDYLTWMTANLDAVTAALGR